jgi:hypothetical protein
MIRLERPEDIKRISVYKEEKVDSYFWHDAKEIKVFEMVTHPWYKFKEETKEYLKPITLKEGFYPYKEFEDEYCRAYFGYGRTEDYFVPKDFSDEEYYIQVKDNTVYRKPCVCFSIENRSNIYIYCDTNEEAVDYAKEFMKYGLTVIIGDI